MSKSKTPKRRRVRSLRKALHPGRLKAGDTITLWCRESSRGEQLAHLADQEANLRNIAASHDLIVGPVFRRLSPGWDLTLLEAAMATCSDQGIRYILAEDASRYLRHRNYTSRNQRVGPTAAQWQELERLARKYRVILLTVLRPNASLKEQRQFQIRRGQSLKSKGGRPAKRRRGEYQPGFESCVNLSKVFWMAKTGLSDAQIAEHLDEKRSTIQSRRERIEERGYSWPGTGAE